MLKDKVGAKEHRKERESAEHCQVFKPGRLMETSLGLLICIVLRDLARSNGACLMWGISSVGRAPALQAGGHRFEPDILHHIYGLIAQSVRALA